MSADDDWEEIRRVGVARLTLTSGPGLGLGLELKPLLACNLRPRRMEIEKKLLVIFCMRCCFSGITVITVGRGKLQTRC